MGDMPFAFLFHETLDLLGVHLRILQEGDSRRVAICRNRVPFVPVISAVWIGLCEKFLALWGMPDGPWIGVEKRSIARERPELNGRAETEKKKAANELPQRLQLSHPNGSCCL